MVSREMGPYLILSADKHAARLRPVLRQDPQKPHLSPSLSPLLFEGFLGSVQAQDAGHLLQESITALSELGRPNCPTTNKV